MAPSTGDPSVYPTSLTTLNGPENFTTWKRDLLTHADSKNVSTLIKGTEATKIRPTRPVKPDPVFLRRKLKSEGLDKDQISDSIKDTAEEWKNNVEEYRLDLSEFEKQVVHNQSTHT